MNMQAIAAIAAAFQKAKDHGIETPKVRLQHDDRTFVISMAPATGRNPGALYIKMGTTYLGKIYYGRFYASEQCDAATEDDVFAVCKAPLEAAVAYGLKYGKCSCCGRTLTNEESIALGIGPICRENYF
jgi:Family of unknown function (DUF6011)